MVVETDVSGAELGEEAGLRLGKVLCEFRVRLGGKSGIDLEQLCSSGGKRPEVRRLTFERRYHLLFDG